MTDAIRPYTRPVPRAAVPQPKPPTRREPVPPASAKARYMTDHERWLNTFAEADSCAGLVTIWRRDADGTYTEFDVLMPNAGVMAVIGKSPSNT